MSRLSFARDTKSSATASAKSITNRSSPLTRSRWTRSNSLADSLPGYRTWTSNNGGYRVKARFIELKDGIVKLEIAIGKTITVPIGRLSDEDQQFIEKNASQPLPKQPK